MDRADGLLGGLRAHASLKGSPRIESLQVEALAKALGIPKKDLPALVTSLTKRTPPALELIYGGSVEVLPAAAPASTVNSVTMDLRYARLSDSAALAGIGPATAGPSTKGLDSATVGVLAKAILGLEQDSAVAGTLAEVTLGLRQARATLSGEAANAAHEAEKVLTTRPAPDAPHEERQAWTTKASQWLGLLVKSAPELKDLVELGIEAVKSLNGT
jgi:hypothetical protein